MGPGPLENLRPHCWSLFSPDTNAQFRSGGASSISGISAQVYDFEVRSENSHWTVHVDSQTLIPAYKGSVWVDPSTARVLRIEMQARNIPSDFPMDTIESAVDYSYVCDWRDIVSASGPCRELGLSPGHRRLQPQHH